MKRGRWHALVRLVVGIGALVALWAGCTLGGDGAPGHGGRGGGGAGARDEAATTLEARAVETRALLVERGFAPAAPDAHATLPRRGRRAALRAAAPPTADGVLVLTSDRGAARLEVRPLNRSAAPATEVD
ncbi:MAG: hypothetical protein IT373_06865, partial [Polyangiaceae bacterium]|nr:hypothetical protein [Polyangiaceae bacterium]